MQLGTSDVVSVRRDPTKQMEQRRRSRRKRESSDPQQAKKVRNKYKKRGDVGEQEKTGAERMKRRTKGTAKRDGEEKRR